MPNGTDDQVGFFALQSKQTCYVSARSLHMRFIIDLVGRLRLQLLKDLLGLCLSRETHCYSGPPGRKI